MKYTDKQLKTWKQEINAIAVIGTRVKLQKDGVEGLGLCPMHKEDTPSFRVYKSDSGDWLYKCFGCGAHGNVFQAIQKLDSCSFEQAVAKVLEISGWQEGKAAADSVFGQVLKSEKKHVTFPLSRMHGAEVALQSNEHAKAWLDERGIDLETAAAFHLGYVDTVSFSPNHPWANNGWIAIPTLDGDTITAVKYRSVMGKKHPSGKAGILRAPNTSTTLFNLDAAQPLDDVYVVEGEPDAIIMQQAGYNAVGYPSAEYTPTAEERDKLKTANRVFLAGDADVPGQNAMSKLWAELRERTYLMEWPDGCKDANDAFKKTCGKDVTAFQELVESAKRKALARPVPDYYDIRETVRNADDTSPMDDPRRLHFRDPNVDQMSIILPGAVVAVYATYSGSGKTTWILDQFELLEAMKYGSVVLNYSAELSPQEFAMLVTANLMEKNRLELTKEDFRQAAELLDETNARFYLGYNPDLNRIGMVLDSLEWAIRRFGAHIVVIDHIHFLCRGERDEVKAQADAMQRIKNMARKYGVIMVVVGQSRKQDRGSSGKRVGEPSEAKGSEALPKGTKVLTPRGWQSIEYIQVGSKVIGSDGQPKTVHTVKYNGWEPSYRVNLSDGCSVECSYGHLWEVRSPNQKSRQQSWKVCRLSDIAADTLTCKAGKKYTHKKYHIPVVKPVQFRGDELPINPYLLGALLGDGTLNGEFPQFTNIDLDILKRVESVLPEEMRIVRNGLSCSYRIVDSKQGVRVPNILRRGLDNLGLWGTHSYSKFIPDVYKYSSIQDRLELLRGLMDTDGHITKTGKMRYTTISTRLAQDVVFLVQSLGGLATPHLHPEPNGNYPSHLLCIWLPDFNPFFCSRKAERVKKQKIRNRSIISIEPLHNQKEMICLGVEDDLFVTEHCIVTHNTFISDSSAAFQIHRPYRRDIDWNKPETHPFDLLDPVTEIRNIKSRTKGPGKAICRQMFRGSVGRFDPYFVQKSS